ncbi:cytochrome b [Paludibacterium yongneupense]|uniref:cytochrome b n=1 Tax=Paludibacterium yongneupense TaxID=400061 RepID=UPI00200AD06A
MSLLHWLVAGLMISTLIVGWLLDDNEGLMALHRSLGIAVLLAVLLRIVNRLRTRKVLPPSVNPAGSLKQRAEQAVHGLLYLCMLGVPLLGWLKTNAAGQSASFFGLFDLPVLLSHNRGLSHLLGGAHSLAATLFVVLLGMHLVGGLAHWAQHRENVLKRITP